VTAPRPSRPSRPRRPRPTAAAASLLVALLLTLLAPSVLRAEAVNQSCAGTPSPWPDTRFKETLSVYLDNYCGYCHSFSVAQSRGLFGPQHDSAAEAAARYLQDPGYSGETSTALAYLTESIARPTIYFTPGYAATTHQMPAYEGLLTDAQIRDLAEFLLTYGDCSAQP
jgi:hypothetical protein